MSCPVSMKKMRICVVMVALAWMAVAIAEGQP